MVLRDGRNVDSYVMYWYDAIIEHIVDLINTDGPLRLTLWQKILVSNPNTLHEEPFVVESSKKEHVLTPDIEVLRDIIEAIIEGAKEVDDATEAYFEESGLVIEWSG